MNAENFLAIDRDLARQVLVFTVSLIAKCFNFAEFEFWGGKNRARGNRKTLKRPKMMSNINFRNLKLKSHEEYLI